MAKKSYVNAGKFVLCFSIIGALIVVCLSFLGANFIENLNNNSFRSVLVFSIINILLILSGIRMKDKYPEYYKYQIISASILLVTAVLFDIIPRLIFLT